MTGPLSDEIRIRHVLDATAEVEHYMDGVTKSQFLDNSEKRFATIKQIEVIGEACNKISDAVKDANPDIPWRQIIGFRNISIHEYHDVSFHIVWDIAIGDLPALKLQFEKLMDALRSS